MKEYTNETPVFSDTLPITETTDVAHPDTINPGPIQAFENTLCNRAAIQQLEEQTRKIKKWSCPVMVGEWSRVLQLTGYQSGTLRVGIFQNNQTLIYKYHISVGYASAFVSQISSTGYAENSDVEIRIVQNKENSRDYCVEILNKYGYQDAEYVTATLEYEEALHGEEAGYPKVWNAMPYTEYTPPDNIYNIVKAELVAKFDGIVVPKLYGDLAGNADTATKAIQDGSGNDITATYAEKSIYSSFVSNGRESGTKIGMQSIAWGENVTASGRVSQAYGRYTEATESFTHAEGWSSVASGSCSHAEGHICKATGENSHAEGNGCVASGYSSHAEGMNTTAANYGSHAGGKYNKNMTTGASVHNSIGDAFVIGNGTNSVLSNAFRVTYTGATYGVGAFNTSGADYAEFVKPWADGNPDNEDRVGYFTTVRDGFLYKAEAGEYIVGITSGNPSIVGNSDEDYYWRYERDEFNRIVMEDGPEMVQQTDEKGNLLFDDETEEPVMVETGNIIKNARMKFAEDYDPALQESYVERKDRKEWNYVGMLGVIPVRDDGTCLPGRFCKCTGGGIATLADKRSFDTFFVLERISENVVSVQLKGL